MSIELVAQREIAGDYGYANQGDRFRVQSEEDAQSLIERGLAKRFVIPPMPAFNPESFKMHTPDTENKMQSVSVENKAASISPRRARR